MVRVLTMEEIYDGLEKMGEKVDRTWTNFKPNKEFRPYPLGWTKTFKEQIRYRDRYKCQNC